MVVGALDAGLRAAALIDLARRPADEVRGSRKAWALALVLANSLGVVPLAYFARGRQRPWTIR
jgi:hypothetical protein